MTPQRQRPPSRGACWDIGQRPRGGGPRVGRGPGRCLRTGSGPAAAAPACGETRASCSSGRHSGSPAAGDQVPMLAGAPGAAPGRPGLSVAVEGVAVGAEGTAGVAGCCCAAAHLPRGSAGPGSWAGVALIGWSAAPRGFPPPDELPRVELAPCSLRGCQPAPHPARAPRGLALASSGGRAETFVASAPNAGPVLPTPATAAPSGRRSPIPAVPSVPAVGGVFRPGLLLLLTAGLDHVAVPGGSGWRECVPGAATTAVTAAGTAWTWLLVSGGATACHILPVLLLGAAAPGTYLLCGGHRCFCGWQHCRRQKSWRTAEPLARSATSMCRREWLRRCGAAPAGTRSRSNRSQGTWPPPHAASSPGPCPASPWGHSNLWRGTRGSVKVGWPSRSCTAFAPQTPRTRIRVCSST